MRPYDVMSFADLEAHVAKLSYWPGWKLSVYTDRHLGSMLRIVATVPDRADPAQTVDLGVNSRVPPHAMRSQQDLAEWVLWRLGEAALHEVREGLRYDGELVDDPHAAQ